MIDLPSTDLSLIREILQKYAPQCKVRVFGSRTKGNADRFSDLDIALDAGRAIDWQKMEKLRDAFSESDLPIIVDIHDWHALSPDFRDIIESNSEYLSISSENEGGGRFD